MGIMENIRKMEHHDKLILVAVVLLLIGAWAFVQDINTPGEARSFLRGELIDLAILLLIADLVIHMGRLEKEVLRDDRMILAEEKVIERKLSRRTKLKKKPKKRKRR